MKRVFFRSILLRYIISYAVVIAVLFVGVGIYVSNSYASAIHSSIVEENTNRLSALRLQHEERLNAIMNIANQISLSPYITPFTLDKDPMKAYHLKQQLVSYNVDKFFDQLYIIFHEDNYMYSSNTSASLELYTEELIHYDNVSADSLYTLIRNQSDSITILPSQNVKSIITSASNTQMATIIVPLRLDGKFSIGNAIFLIQDSAYQRMFADEIDRMRNMYIFYADNILSATRPINVTDEFILSNISGSEDMFIRDITDEKGDSYILFVQRSSLLDMRYVSLIPQETVQMQTARSRLGFALFMLLLSIPCSLLTVYFARRHVRPIRELQRSFGDTGVSNEDGFTVIRRGIESLRGQNEDLHTRLDESKEAFMADFVKNFVKCRFVTREKAVNTAISIGMDIDRAFYCVSLVAAVPHKSNGLEQLYTLVSDYEYVNGYGMEIIDQEQYLFVLFSDKQKALKDWAEAAKDILSSIDKEAVIAFSNVHVDFSEATSAYLEASTAYDNRFVMGNEYVLWFSEVSAAARDIESFSSSYLDGFRKALYAGDAHALNDRINELFQILRDKKFSLFAFRIIYNDIISMLLNKYFSYEGASKDTIQYYDIFELSRCRRVADLLDILRDLCNDILHKEEQNAPQEQSVIGKVINYIRDHYAEPEISMGFIAGIFGMSAANLSLKYKEQTGMYPSEYLILLRMEKAKELLTKTKMPIQYVGTEVGYYDASSFIRRFKKHMGVTPAQYRKILKKQGDGS